MLCLRSLKCHLCIRKKGLSQSNMLTQTFCLLGSLKIFLPIAALALLVLIPANVSGGTLLDLRKEVVFSDIDKLSISNVNPGSNR